VYVAVAPGGKVIATRSDARLVRLWDPTGRLLQQLIAESLLLSVAGAALGFLFALLAAKAAASIPLPVPIPIRLRIEIREAERVVRVSHSSALRMGCGERPQQAAQIRCRGDLHVGCLPRSGGGGKWAHSDCAARGSNARYAHPEAEGTIS